MDAKYRHILEYNKIQYNLNVLIDITIYTKEKFLFLIQKQHHPLK